MSMPKILSPVTSYQGATQVISAGADEIYCAVKIPGAVHFLNRPESCCVSTYGELGRIAEYAHSKGVEAIVTLELPFVSQFMAAQMEEHISSCANEGIDALIVGDIGLIKMVRELGLAIPMYASTMLGVMNYEAVDFMRELGVKRVVPERHMSIEEIGEAVQRCKDVEIEVFVHGGGCSNINANCYLEFARASEAAASRALRGIKAMPNVCRYAFDIYEFGSDERRIARTSILDAFTFCSLCDLPELIETGVSGLKIVGRCWTLAYQVNATKMYRDLIELMRRGGRRGFNRTQRKRFHGMVESFKEDPFLPAALRPGVRNRGRSFWSHSDVLCAEGRCYYSPFFHAAYKESES
jgi:putative protease